MVRQSEPLPFQILSKHSLSRANCLDLPSIFMSKHKLVCYNPPFRGTRWRVAGRPMKSWVVTSRATRSVSCEASQPRSKLLRPSLLLGSCKFSKHFPVFTLPSLLCLPFHNSLSKLKAPSTPSTPSTTSTVSQTVPHCTPCLLTSQASTTH